MPISTAITVYFEYFAIELAGLAYSFQLQSRFRGPIRDSQQNRLAGECLFTDLSHQGFPQVIAQLSVPDELAHESAG